MACPTTADPALLLASASPRRAELLAQLGLDFEVCPADIDEDAVTAPAPRSRVLAVARAKGAAVAARPRQLVLSADTSVVLDEHELGKPRDREEAMAMLGRLSDRAHWVYTAVVVRRDDRSAEVVAATRVWFAPLTRQAIARYCDGPEPYDKAGAYGIQGRAAVFIHRIEGSYSNVVGLPLFETAQLLERFGIRP